MRLPGPRRFLVGCAVVDAVLLSLAGLAASSARLGQILNDRLDRTTTTKENP